MVVVVLEDSKNSRDRESAARVSLAARTIGDSQLTLLSLGGVLARGIGATIALVVVVGSVFTSTGAGSAISGWSCVCVCVVELCVGCGVVCVETW